MKKKIIYSCLLSLSVFACSLPNQEIKNDKLNIKSNTKDKKFKTKSLSIFHHPSRVAEFNADAYQYAFPPPDITPGTEFDHYNNWARDHEYQTRIRNPEYFTALKCIADGFDEKSYKDAHPDIPPAISNGTIPSAYFHYKLYEINEGRLDGQNYRDALKTNKVFREEAYFNAHPNIHSTIKYALDNNFTTSNFVNAYEHYLLNRDTNPAYSQGNEYQTALNDHIDGFWNDSYLLAFIDILQAGWLTHPYPHYNNWGKNEGRLSQQVYIDINNVVGIHPGQTKTVEFSGTKKTFNFIGLPNWKYRFILNEMSEEDAYLKIIDPDTNEVIIENDDTYGLDSFVEFKVPLKKIYKAEVSTSNNGVSSNTPQGKFLLTMFHSFYDPVMVAKDSFRMSSISGSWSYGGYDPNNNNQFYLYSTPWGNANVDEYLTSPTWLSGGGGIVGHHIKDETISYSQVTLAPKQIILHPGGNGEKAVLRWIAQMNGNYSINALFKGLSGNNGSPITTTDVHINKNGTEIFNGNINLNGGGNDSSFVNNQITLNAGETIDFVVGNGGNNHLYDSTGLDVTITKS